MSFSKDQIFALFAGATQEASASTNLLTQWIYWNNSPSRYLSPETWQEWIGQRDPQFFLSTTTSRRYLDRFLANELGWQGEVGWNPDDLLLQIAMMAHPRLVRLSYLAASITLHEEIAKVIDGGVVRQLRETLGKDVIEFVLFQSKNARYQVKDFKALVAEQKDLLSHLKKLAQKLLEQAFSGREEVLQKRLAIKHPGIFQDQYYKKPAPLAQQAEEFITQLWKENLSWL